MSANLNNLFFAGLACPQMAMGDEKFLKFVEGFESLMEEFVR